MEKAISMLLCSSPAVFDKAELKKVIQEEVDKKKFANSMNQVLGLLSPNTLNFVIECGYVPNPQTSESLAIIIINSNTIKIFAKHVPLTNTRWFCAAASFISDEAWEVLVESHNIEEINYATLKTVFKEVLEFNDKQAKRLAEWYKTDSRCHKLLKKHGLMEEKETIAQRLRELIKKEGLEQYFPEATNI
jgi:hypothetical protein